MTSQRGSAAERLPWRPRDATVAVTAGIAASVLVLALLGGEADPLRLFGLVVPAQSAATIAAIGVLSKRRTEWRQALSASIVGRDAWGLLVGAGLQVGLGLIAYLVVVGLLGGEAPTQEVVEAAAEAVRPLERWMMVLGVVLLAPISEELVFRGVLLGALRRTRTDRYAVVVSAAVFAGIHLLDPNAVLAVPFLFVTGIVLGRSVIVTGRLGRAVAIHAGFNGVTVLALLAV